MRKLCGAVLAAFCALGVEAGGEVRYLAASGDDAADGKTPATAWRTIEHANDALPDLRIRFGNGIELGGDAEDVIVERCSFLGVYDVCFTMQGYPKKGWSDVCCRNCTMTDCTQAFEVWCQRAPKGVGFKRCSFTGNRTLRVGGGWGALVRTKREVATPLLIYRMDTDTIDIKVTGNTFENMPRGLIFNRGGVNKIPNGYRIYDNIVK